MSTGFICEAILPACAVCGAPFEPKYKAQKCCAAACGNVLGKLKGDATRSANAARRRVRTCERCGEGFTMRNPSGKARSGRAIEGRYCSRKCQADSTRIYSSAEKKKASERRRRIRLGLARPASKPCVLCSAPFQPKTIRSRYCSDRCGYAAADPINREPRPCRECSQHFTPVMGDYRRGYCSDPCARRNRRRIAKALRRARMHGAGRESVDPIVVFERDGWRCHLCQVRTPRRLRGTLDPCAPELDHIIPLAAGGEHSYRNTACACRSCNGIKGASVQGQLRLFG